jgi:hypothetical protein
MSRRDGVARAFVLSTAVGCQSIAPTRPATNPAMAPTPIPIARFRLDSLAFTTFSGLSDSVRVVIRDDARWHEYWQRIHSPFIPQPPVPPIDFAREAVVVAALGPRPNAGYDILIQAAQRDSAGIQVFLRRSNPGPGCPVSAVVAQPVDLARIAAIDVPVRFVERITTIPCGVR